MSIQLVHGPSIYKIGKLVGQTDEYRLYTCKQEGRDSELLLQIAREAQFNGKLDRAAYVLRELSRRASEIEEEYTKKFPGKQLNYDLAFPHLVNSFICPEQGRRRVNVLEFFNVEEVGKMVPLINITKDRLRVDLRTSAWIMGKLLKLLTFVHSEGICARLVTMNNVLIEPTKHYVLIFDWSQALTGLPDTIPPGERRRDIAAAALAVIAVLGGSPEAGIPERDEVNSKYIDFILALAKGRTTDAMKAHHDFYEIVDGLWPREYYQFTTKSL